MTVPIRPGPPVLRSGRLWSSRRADLTAALRRSSGRWVIRAGRRALPHRLGPAGRPGQVADQALTDRDAGTLLVRDAGAVHDTRWLQQRADLPRIIRSGRHIARTRRYLRGFAVEVEPRDLVEAVRKQARAGDGWVKLVGDWIDRDDGDLAACFPAGGAQGRRPGRPR